jgi:hypothetical protein
MALILFLAGCATMADTNALTITATVTNEGVECPAVRTDDGKLYTIATKEKLTPGMRVRITGTIAEASFCMQGTTIAATKIEVLSADR